jgi:hypothetical protein
MKRIKTVIAMTLLKALSRKQRGQRKCKTGRTKVKSTRPMQYRWKATSRLTKGMAFGAMLACLIMLETGSAVAAVNPVLRNLTKQTFTGQCCVSFDEEVSITEPSALKPVVVTWDTGYEINAADDYIAGLSVNGGACQASSAGGVFGAELIPDYQLASGKFSHISFQWIILPSDGVLVAGKNTFVLCGGGLSFSSDSISILDNTLFAQLVK